MADDLLTVLTRFHREVLLPDVERIMEERLKEQLAPFRDDVLANFDAVFKRLDRLESEYHALSAAVARLEKRVEAMDRKLAEAAMRSEVLELREKLAGLEKRLAQVEAELSH